MIPAALTAAWARGIRLGLLRNASAGAIGGLDRL